MNLSRTFALWRQDGIAWGDIGHACILYGRQITGGDAPFADSVAARLGIDIVRASAADWQIDPYVIAFVEAMVRTFDEAAGRTPCVLSLDDLHRFPGTAIARSPFLTVATSAFLTELDDALKVPGLIIIISHLDCAALAPALLPPLCTAPPLAVRISGVARDAANDNEPRAPALLLRQRA